MIETLHRNGNFAASDRSSWSHKDHLKVKQPLLYLAPLHGLTDVIYRTTWMEYFSDIDLLFAPFIPANKGKRITPKLVRDILPENTNGLATIPQIMGNSAEAFINLSTYLFDWGYRTINWNLGCPYPMVAKKGRGSGLLSQPDRIEALLERIVPNIPNQLSIKTRLGRWDEREIDALIPIFNRFPLNEIIIHPRTGIQMYAGSVNLPLFEACRRNIVHPVVYNGDIVSLEDHVHLQHRFDGLERWMIGRGVLMNPFLPWEIKHNQRIGSDRLEILRRFHGALFDRYQTKMSGPGHLLDRMKGIWYYMTHSFGKGAKYFKAIKKTRHLDDYWRIVDRIFREAEFPADRSV